VTLRCIDLRAERLVDPLGLDTRTPRLSWRLEADRGESDVAQQVYRVEVDGRWDTGRVDGWRQQVTYSGPALESRTAARWRVRAWTTEGDTEWSEWATFETGILDAGEWEAVMIGAPAATPVVRFARVVDMPRGVVRARLRLTAHGMVTASIAGIEVGDEVFAPGWTSYDHRLIVRTHDVTALLTADDTEVAFLVAPGWYAGRLGWEGKRAFYGADTAVFAQLEIDVADGTRVVIGTDDTWTAATTPFTFADLYDGETFDARRPVAGEAVPVVAAEAFDARVLCAQPVPPVRRTEELRPVSCDGGVIDFGQNLVGRLRITVRNAPSGTEIVMRHAEVLDPDGRLFTEPLRTAQATDTYICRGADEEIYEPTFTFHGFRYAAVTGVDLDSVEVVAVVLHSDVERIGRFACSDPLLVRLHENVVWGQRGNFVSVPTDCPQRDERLGWTGDAQVFSPTASFLYDCETFWENWLADLEADQKANGSVPHVVPSITLGFDGAAGWGDAAVVVPWTTYVAYGDETVLRAALPSMRAWVDYVSSRLDENHCWTGDFQFGDWLDPDAPIEQPWRAKARFDLVATAYAVRSATLLSRAAAIIGDDATARRYADHAAMVRVSWWEQYSTTAATTQTGAALAIMFDLLPDEEARHTMGEALARRVHEAGDHLSTGFLGTPILLPALTATGHLDVAYDVLRQRTLPSWLYQVCAGATTIWERWDALRPDGSIPTEALGVGSGSSMVSFNHYAYGAVAEWLHTTVAGLRADPEDPGYHHFFVEPRPGGELTHASASLQTRYGPISVAWRRAAGRLDGRGLHLDLAVPPNTSATVTLPGREAVRVGSGSHSLD
jgi:alpha-L-rhamnosidase